MLVITKLSYKAPKGAFPQYTIHSVRCIQNVRARLLFLPSPLTFEGPLKVSEWIEKASSEAQV